jgi:hypothetical protein
MTGIRMGRQGLSSVAPSNPKLAFGPVRQSACVPCRYLRLPAVLPNILSASIRPRPTGTLCRNRSLHE